MIVDAACRAMEEKFDLQLPKYPGYDQIVELPRVEEEGKL